MRRKAFTLVEILVVLLVIGILAGMVSAAVRAAGQTARIARTRGIIATIDDVLLTKFESYKTRPLPIVVPQFDASLEVSLEVPPREAARIRLIMLRDLMRMEMPDRISDVNDRPAIIQGAVRRVMVDSSTGQYSYAPNLVPKPIDWFNNANPPSKLVAYRDRRPVPATNWTREHEGAECLYLIMATTFMDGVPAISSIPGSNIADTDEDGMPEILDGWGQPLGFIRWPIGYTNTDGTIPGLNSDGVLDGASVPDEFDLFKIDWAFVPGTSSVPPARPDITGSVPYSLRPLVVSAGPDGVFDLRFGFGDPADWQTDIRYAQMTWPTTAAQMGNDSTGRASPYYYIDPFDRQRPAANGRLGEPVDVEGDGDGQRADNITNYTLQETT